MKRERWLWASRDAMGGTVYLWSGKPAMKPTGAFWRGRGRYLGTVGGLLSLLTEVRRGQARRVRFSVDVQAREGTVR